MDCLKAFLSVDLMAHQMVLRLVEYSVEMMDTPLAAPTVEMMTAQRVVLLVHQLAGQLVVETVGTKVVQSVPQLVVQKVLKLGAQLAGHLESTTETQTAELRE